MLAVYKRLVRQLEVVLDVDPELRLREVPDVAHARPHHELAAQELVDRLGLGGRLDDDQGAAPSCPAATLCLGLGGDLLATGNLCDRLRSGPDSARSLAARRRGGRLLGSLGGHPDSNEGSGPPFREPREDGRSRTPSTYYHRSRPVQGYGNLGVSCATGGAGSHSRL